MPWQRHQLVQLSDAGWQEVSSQAWDEPARDCIAHWVRHRGPLVVTRQRDPRMNVVDLGLAAPVPFGRRRLAIEVSPDALRRAGSFPRPIAIEALLPIELRDRWRALDAALTHRGCHARVYGSHGWQALTGLPYLHADSDIDLLLPVDGVAMADAVCTTLAAAPIERPRLDGELMFPDGAGIAWREWHSWRAGRTSRVLVKRLHGAALEDDATRWSRAAC
jgi:phosphoribosyl-dephospho-CoA transferase